MRDVGSQNHTHSGIEVSFHDVAVPILYKVLVRLRGLDGQYFGGRGRVKRSEAIATTCLFCAKWKPF